jgi:hypothetical protein
MKIGLPTSSLGHFGSSGRQHLVDHEISNHISCDQSYGLHNHVSMNTASSLITSHSWFISKKWKTMNPSIKNAISIQTLPEQQHTRIWAIET